MKKIIALLLLGLLTVTGFGQIDPEAQEEFPSTEKEVKEMRAHSKRTIDFMTQLSGGLSQLSDHIIKEKIDIPHEDRLALLSFFGTLSDPLVTIFRRVSQEGVSHQHEDFLARLDSINNESKYLKPKDLLARLDELTIAAQKLAKPGAKEITHLRNKTLGYLAKLYERITEMYFIIREDMFSPREDYIEDYSDIRRLADPINTVFDHIHQEGVSDRHEYFLVQLDDIIEEINYLKYKDPHARLDALIDALVVAAQKLDEVQKLAESKKPIREETAFPATLSVAYSLKALNDETEALYLAAQALQTVPEDVLNHTQLVTLDLQFNKIQALPKSFGQLQKLQVLNLSHNRFGSKILDKVPNIHNIGATNYSLAPDYFVLYDSGCEILDQLPHLQQLDLSYNELAELPESFGDLPKLQQLNLRHNQLQWLPERFGQLPYLEQLDLSRNKLSTETVKQFLRRLRKLPKLQVLDLSHNRFDLGSASIYDRPPRNLRHLKSLQQLNLSHCRIEKLPKSLQQLQSLAVIDLSNNRLRKLPKSFRKLQKLQQLNLSGNDISDKREEKIRQLLPKCDIHF